PAAACPARRRCRPGRRDRPRREGGAAMTTAPSRPMKAQLEAGDQKPPALAVEPSGIPEKLKARQQWVCWCYERRQDKKSQKWRWTKVPKNPRTGRNASPTGPTTWGTFNEALARYLAGHADGVGYVFAADDPFAGVDLDDAVDPAT